MALGRGLGELLGEVESAYENSTRSSNAGVTKIDVSSIKANPNQPRKIFDEEKLKPRGGAIGNTNYWNWLGDEKLLIAGDFEITIFDSKNSSRQLITRISEKVTGLTWSKKKKYLIYTTDKNINSIDLYEGDGRITKLLDGNKISQPRLDEKNKILYFQADSNGALTWQKIEVQ